LFVELLPYLYKQRRYLLVAPNPKLLERLFNLLK